MSDRVTSAPPSGNVAVEAGAGPAADALQAAHAICPFLVAAAGDWRRLGVAREHVCAAVDPPAAVAAEKQRRLCLAETHRDCATYVAARHARELAPAAARLGTEARWPIPRTAPVVVDRGRPSLASLRLDRSVVQGGLIVLMIAAFAVLALARLTAPGSGPAAGPSISPSPTAQASPSPSQSPSPRPSLAPSPSGSPSSSPSSVPSVGPSPAPSTATSTRTYTVRAGDSLSAIAARLGTTVALLRELNDIPDPSLLRVGQVLRIP
jgi:LysM repeat protein